MIKRDGAEMIDQALSVLRRKPVDAYEVYLEQSSHFYVESKDGKVDTLQASHSLGRAFRILNRQRMGFSYTTSSQEEASGGVEPLIDDAIRSAEATSPDPSFDFAPCLEESLPPLPIFDETLQSVSEKTKIEKTKLLEEAARSVDPGKVKKVRKASYEEIFSRVTLVNSNGLHASYATTFTSVSVTAVAEESGESEMGWDFDFSHFIKDLDVEKVGREAGRMALGRLGGKRIASGVFPVILHHQVASEFLSLLAHSFLAEQVQKGKSHLKGKRGERAFSPLISLADDGRYEKGISTSPIDGEGVPSQRTPLISRGEICGYLYDRYWADRENISSPGLRVQSTGNSRRSNIKSPPGLGISNLYIEPGDQSFSKLMEDLYHGLAVEEVMGLHTVNPISGDFSLGCSGYWIDKGEKVYPVKSIAVAGNLFQLFQKVIGLGRDLRFFGRTGSPSLLVEGLEISGN